MTELKTITCETLMTTPLNPIVYCVDRMISTGLFVLAGEPKVGKSWLALDLALSIAKGEKVLGRDTIQGTALYLCLEDSYARLQNRLFELTSEPTENLHLAIAADTIGKGLEQQILKFSEQHIDLRIVIVDTLQKIRAGDETSYALEYKELSSLKFVADKLKIALMIVHHTSKRENGNAFMKISGTTAITGCADGSFVLRNAKQSAELVCTGRDIESFILKLQRSGARWTTTEIISAKPPDTFSFMIHDFMLEQKYFKGTPSELTERLKIIFGADIPPNKITQKLVQHGVELQELGVRFEIKRSNGLRFIILSYDLRSDGSDGCFMWVDITVTAVTPELANALPMRSEDSDGSS